jgi:uncharacterized protein (DUF1330 family)
MSVYVLIEANLKSQEKFNQFVEAFSNTIAQYDGVYLVRGGRIACLDGGMKPDRRQPEQILLVEFLSEVNLRRCIASPEYQAIIALRDSGAEIRALILEGVWAEEK